MDIHEMQTRLNKKVGDTSVSPMTADEIFCAMAELHRDVARRIKEAKGRDGEYSRGVEDTLVHILGKLKTFLPKSKKDKNNV